MRLRLASCLVFACAALTAQRVAGGLGGTGQAIRKAGNSGNFRSAVPPLVNPWANPYLPFAVRLAATVSGSWAGTIPTRLPGGFGVGLNPSRFAWQPPYLPGGPIYMPSWSSPVADSNLVPPNGYAMYAGPPPVYPAVLPPPHAAPPPMPMRAFVRAPEEILAEPPSSTRISPRHAIGPASETSSEMPESVSKSNEECPAMIELKNGSVFTVTSYWLTGKTLHFITTRFDHFTAPYAEVVRLSPRKSAQPLDHALRSPVKGVSSAASAREVEP